MYVRMARFEGGTSAEMEEQTERMRQDIEALGRGEKPPMLPQELARLATKLEVLSDRENVKVAVLVYCETAQDAAEVDRILDSMNPGPGPSRRVSADVYEVVLDQAVQRSQRAA